MILPQREAFDNSRKQAMYFSRGKSDKISGAVCGIIRAMDHLYLDLWFGLNLLCDYLLCLLTARSAGLYLRRVRYALASLFGAVFACVAPFPSLGFLSLPGWKLLAGALMGWIAFGAERHPLRCVLLFFAVSASFGGALLALSGGRPLRISPRELLFSFLLCYGIGTLLFRFGILFQPHEKRSIAIEHGGREAHFQALIDTGNSLRDPVSGAHVLIATPQALREILQESAALFEALGPVQLQALSTQIPELAGRLRLLPYSAVGGKGLIPAFRPERLFIDGQEHKDYLIGISPHIAGDDFDAIL